MRFFTDYDEEKNNRSCKTRVTPHGLLWDLRGCSVEFSSAKEVDKLTASHTHI